jgi:hypothetical protein
MSYGIKEDQNMPRKKHTPEEIVAKLRHVDVLFRRGLRWPTLRCRSG